ncbi:MAG: acyl-CoA dehydrogenase family protein [Polyangiales bacterium]
MTIRYDEMTQAIGHNWYRVDPNLIGVIQRLVAEEDRSWCDEKLSTMGDLIGNRIAKNAEHIDKHPAELVRWDRDGDETNRVEHSPAALDSKRLLWKHNVIHLTESDEVVSRGRPSPAPMHIAYFYLLSQCDTGMLCSIGMTSGVLRLIERYGDDETRAMFLEKLSRNDFDEGWDGSMYLTEKAGGSDLGMTETVATRRGSEWRLNGFKWFCSNVDGDVIVALARPEGNPAGVKGLGLFAVPRLLSDGSQNGMRIRRIKEKMGTRSVPTGEVDFVDAVAYPLSRDGSPDDGKGINRMMAFVNQSRLAVAAMGAGIMRRVFLEAAIRTSHRVAFGKPLNQQPMVREQLIDLLCESEAAAALLFECASRTPEDHLTPIGDGDPVARILVPLTKMRCTRGGVVAASAALELFGGNGFIENWPMARQYRDAQCHTLWEGTENLLALDVLRTMAHDESHVALLERLGRCTSGATHPLLANTRRIVQDAIGRLTEDVLRVAGEAKSGALLHARHLANEMADVSQCALVLEEAQHELDHRGTARKAVVAAWLARARCDARHEWSRGNEGIVTNLFEPLVAYGDLYPDDVAKYV